MVLLTFLDPVCTSDCPVIAQEFRAADQMLGRTARHIELVAIVANPIYRSVAYTRAFDQQERLTGLPNWLYLTGTLGQLRQAWKNYAVAADVLPAGGMIAHSDVAFVIDASGHTRSELNFDPGPGTSSTESSFAAELTNAAERVSKPVMKQPGAWPLPPRASRHRRRGRCHCGLRAGCGLRQQHGDDTADDGRSGRAAATGHGFHRPYRGRVGDRGDGWLSGPGGQLLGAVRAAGGNLAWRLATPAGVANNGGLEAAGTGGSLVAGFRPSQDLTFSPLAATSDDGASWSAAGPVTPGLADAPDALASGSGGQLIALTSGGTAELGAKCRDNVDPPGQRPGDDRPPPAGHDCGLTGLTAATFARSEVPMLAGELQPAGNRGHLCRSRRELAGGRPAVPGHWPARTSACSGSPRPATVSWRCFRPGPARRPA